MVWREGGYVSRRVEYVRSRRGGGLRSGKDGLERRRLCVKESGVCTIKEREGLRSGVQYKYE